MIQRITHPYAAKPDSDPLGRATRAPVVTAVFHDPDAAGRAYDIAVELGYANEEISAAATAPIPPELVSPASDGQRFRAVLLAVQPRCEEEGRWIVERWRAYGGREVAGIR